MISAPSAFSSECYNSILAPVWGIEYEGEGMIVWWNSTYEELWGKRPRESQQSWDWWTERIHPADREPTVMALRTAIDHCSGMFECSYRFREIHGAYHEVLDRVQIVRSASSRPVRVLGIMFNQSLLLKQMQAYKNWTQRYELAIFGADLGTWDWHIPSGAVVFNQRWAEMLGYAIDDIEPRVSSWEKLVHPNDLKLVMEILERHLIGNTPFYESEHRMLHKEGHWIWVLDKGKVIERDSSGKPVRACGTHLDISWKREAEEVQKKAQVDRLKQYDEHLEVLAKEFSLGTLLLNREKRICQASPYAKTLLHGDFVGQTCREILGCDCENCLNCPVSLALQGQSSSKIVQRKNPSQCGVFQFIKIVARPSSLDSPEPQILALLEDVTEMIHHKGTGDLFSCSKQEIYYNRYGMIGLSEGIRRVFKKIDRASFMSCTTLLLGETGVGKEHVARALHKTGQKKNGPVMVANCGAMPDNLLESELFGHVKGAFTGAAHSKLGLFRSAEGGTIFLDEIEAASPRLQASLLRVIEHRILTPVGSSEALPINVSIVAASNIDLEKACAEKHFRPDLMYRLSENVIHIPPLRERLEDIEPLATHFFEELNIKGRVVKYPSPKVIALLKSYSWPGNIRELRNLILQLIRDINVPLIQPIHLPEVLRSSVQTTKVSTLIEQEKKLVSEALDRVNGNKSDAARILGVSRGKMYALMSKHHLGIWKESSSEDVMGCQVKRPQGQNWTS